MTDPAPHAPPDIAEALKKIKDLLTAAVGTWPGADDAGPSIPSSDGSSPAVSAASPQGAADSTTDEIAQVRKKYDGMLRWMVGVFSAVGLLIFGTLPFTDLQGIDWEPAAIGLSVAGTGLAVVIWATTKGLEPQDASLGELSMSFEALNRWTQFRWLQPRKKAIARLESILNTGEREAHLGPGIRTVPELIGRLADLESMVLGGEVGWNGRSPLPSSAANGAPWKDSSAFRTTGNRSADDLAKAYQSYTSLIAVRAELSPATSARRWAALSAWVSKSWQKPLTTSRESSKPRLPRCCT